MFTVIELAVDPDDHRLLKLYEEFKVVCPPEQNVVGPEAVITGAAGKLFTVTVVGEEGFDVHPFPSVTVTVYEPLVETEIEGVVAPVDQVFPEVAEELSVTLDPWQMATEAPFVIVGVAGSALTVTFCGADAPEVHPFVITCTTKVPELLTVMDCVVAPLDHKLLVAEEDVNTTEPPAQNVVGPLAVIVGTAGIGLAVTVIGALDGDVQPETV